MRPLLANLSSPSVVPVVCFNAGKLGAAAVCVERAGELFSRTVASNSKSVCSISQELLFPLLMTERKRY